MYRVRYEDGQVGDVPADSARPLKRFRANMQEDWRSMEVPKPDEGQETASRKLTPTVEASGPAEPEQIVLGFWLEQYGGARGQRRTDTSPLD
jgi:hypothetical protein